MALNFLYNTSPSTHQIIVEVPFVSEKKCQSTGLWGWGKLNVPGRQTDWFESWLSPLPAVSLGFFTCIPEIIMSTSEEVIQPSCGYQAGSNSIIIIIIIITISSDGNLRWPIEGCQENTCLFKFTHGKKQPVPFTKWFKFTKHALCKPAGIASCPGFQHKLREQSIPGGVASSGAQQGQQRQGDKHKELISPHLAHRLTV